ncbi:hypothetical protein DH2020_010447 [Rehmannia glutinosa]|uniref:Uncharacterized protein n=1 Tax=Rehmannia glutinosa TaxID=99300 RepID=A0ABR0XAM5_REHGL
MAETFLFNITEGVLSKVSSLAIEQISSACNIKTEVRKLQNTLSTIKAVILDADEQQSKNHEVRDWLEKLKDAVYDIDDLLDDLSTQVLQRNMENFRGIMILKKVTRFFSSSNPIASRFKIVHRVKGLRKKLDEIAEDRNKFHFNEKAILIPVDNNHVREQTHSFVIASDIIGRDGDKENIVKLLVSSDCENEEVLVISIVGIGGLGKTTVVKLAYNDDRVIQSFDLGMWVSVSEDFRVGKVVEKILKSTTGESLGHLDMDQMQRRLVDVLSDKKYLLVLDDVWNDDRNKWMDLMELLKNGRAGSKIIVTTRSKAVATITSTTSPYNLTEPFFNSRNVRSFRCAFKVKPLDKTLIEAIVRNFRRLRVLILNGLQLEELPSSIGDLTLLKYFDLSQSSNIKSLPKSICKLLNLQTLNLINCENFQDLPRNFGDLVSMRTLYLTCQEMSLRKKSPQSFTSLQFLLLYNCDFIQLPSELQHFASIRVLRIYDCPRLASLPNGIKYLSKLEKLWIWNCEELDLSEGDGLQGLTGLQSLLLMGLPKLIDLPVGLKENVVKTLKFLRVANCANFSAFPDWLVSFSMLQRLYIEDCPNLFFLPEGVHKNIAKLHISGCPNLASFGE